MPDLLAVHGFGTCSAVWEDLRARLGGEVRLKAVDLPGHGGSPAAALSLPELARACAAEIDAPAIWLGWSFGGLVALKAAELLPQRVQAVVTVAMGPRFEAAPDWPNAMDPEELDGFEARLKSRPAAALGRFYSLQARTRKGANVGLTRRLKALSGRCGGFDTATLIATLRLLRQSDLRDTASALRCPLLSLLGSDDALVPSAVAADLPRVNPRWRVRIIEAAGHVPFLSHASEFERCLVEFLRAQSEPRAATPP